MDYDYEKQGRDFLEETGTEFLAEYVRYGPHFNDEIVSRDIWRINLSRGSRSYTFLFGQSTDKSGVWVQPLTTNQKVRIPGKPGKRPTPYDVLACLSKYEPGTFKEFCGEMGYDTDSIKARELYILVMDEWINVQRLWGDEHMKLLREIQ